MNASARRTRVIFATQNEYCGCQRKLAWFSKHGNDLYFELGGFFVGSHTSYHRDGNVFRTSPATKNQPHLIGKHLPLSNFAGWYQLGAAMISKAALSQNPCLKSRDRNEAIALRDVDLNQFPSTAINFVVELLDPSFADFLASESVRPPSDAVLFVIDTVTPWIVVTVLGHDHNLIIKPGADGFEVSHFNSRYSTNQLGRKYTYEAYRPD